MNTLGPRPDLCLRPLRDGDEGPCLAAHAALAAEDFDFLLAHDPSKAWHEHVVRTVAMVRGSELPDGFVPCTFLVAVCDGVIVGRSSVRFELTPWLETVGGHVGYCVLRDHRRRGYTTEILRQSLVIARVEGIDDVLVTCDEHNVASAGVIERCGGEFDGLVVDPRGGPRKRRYWIRG